MTDVLLLRDRGAEAVKKNLKFCQQANLNLYNTCTEYNVTMSESVCRCGRNGTFPFVTIPARKLASVLYIFDA